MPVVTTRQLLESGVHFGHQTRRWNPKMKRFILTERNGIYIIDLHQSLTYIDSAYAFVKETVSRGGSVLFVGTKKQAQETVAEQATRVGMPYVNQRWLGGMLTNFHTVIKRIQRLKELEGMDFDDVAGSGFTKKELLGFRRERDKLEKTLGGIRDMARTPQAVWIVDTKKEHLAVDEARKLKIPIIGILDTNCDPDEVDYAIPGNDDAIRSVALLTRVLADAVADGLMARSGAQTGTEATNEPMPDWERELLGNADAAPVADQPANDADAAPGAVAGETTTIDATDLPTAADGPADEEVLVPANEVPEVAAENAELADDAIEGKAPDRDTDASAPAADN
jgi:small subunit ribosomal protein S2